jgi:transcriptional regulator with XRE-family HTH domain
MCREAAGLSAFDVQDQTGISRSALSRYERDELVPRRPYLTVLAALYGVDEAALDPKPVGEFTTGGVAVDLTRESAGRETVPDNNSYEQLEKTLGSSGRPLTAVSTETHSYQYFDHDTQVVDLRDTLVRRSHDISVSSPEQIEAEFQDLARRAA